MDIEKEVLRLCPLKMSIFFYCNLVSDDLCSSDKDRVLKLLKSLILPVRVDNILRKLSEPGEVRNPVTRSWNKT